MQPTLQPMNETEFQIFQKHSGKLYVEQILASTALTREEAEARAKSDGEKLLPQGLHTPNALLLSIRQNANFTGYLWFQLNKDKAFAYALEIFPEAKGHGLTALRQAREILKARGIKKIALHVFARNERAARLYQKVGFKVDSYNMSLDL